jgi:hypothetical protein
MERFGEDNTVCSCHHESLDESRNITSVSSSAPALHIGADHFVLCSATIYGLQDDPRIGEMYTRFGPTPRICFDFLEVSCRIPYETCHQDALYGLSLEKLRDIVSQGKRLSLDADTLLLVRRVPKRDLIREGLNIRDNRDLCYASSELITQGVELELQKHIWNAKRSEQVKLYESLECVEGTRPIAGVVFEVLAQKKFQNNIKLDLIPMVRRVQGMSRWHSAHTDGAISTSIRIPVKVMPLSTVKYPGFGPNEINNKVYYVPEARNQVAFDSFIVVDSKLFIFQFTISSEHRIKEGIVPFFSQPRYHRQLPPKASWHFVFVVPSGPRSELSCPHPREDELKELMIEMKLFSAVTDPKERPPWYLSRLFKFL